MAEKIKCIIDTDPGVDDAIAILLALNSPEELDVLWISLVAWNVKMEDIVNNCFTVLELAWKKDEVKVYKWADKPLEKELFNAYYIHWSWWLGEIDNSKSGHNLQEQFSVDFLVETVNANPWEITVFALGPLTNIALAIQKDPNWAKNVKKLIRMWGCECKWNASPVAEFNAYVDPEAAKIVFWTEFKDLMMVWLDVTSRNILKEKMKNYIKSLNTPMSDFIYKMVNKFIDINDDWEEVSMIHDAATIMYALDNSFLKLKDAFVDVETTWICRWQTVVDDKWHFHDWKCNAKVACDIKPEMFLDYMFKRILKIDNEEYKNYMG